MNSPSPAHRPTTVDSDDLAFAAFMDARPADFDVAVPDGSERRVWQSTQNADALRLRLLEIFEEQAEDGAAFGGVTGDDSVRLAAAANAYQRLLAELNLPTDALAS